VLSVRQPFVKINLLSSLRLELASGVLIGKINYFKLSGVDVQYSPDKDILEGYSWVLALLEKGPFVF
jgi:hypothetical protein